jgi:hypothetical protein
MALAGGARAGTFLPQASFPLPFAAVKSLDRDAVGNLYVLGRPDGSSTYSVAVYQTQDIQPLQSFDTGLDAPFAFSVEASGSPDILAYDQTTGAFFLKRFGNTGAVLGQTTMPYTITRGYAYSTALDRVNARVYISKFWRITPCFDLLAGCDGPPPGTQGFVYQYDFQGNLLRTIALPGNTSAAGSCYEPRVMTVDPQGNLVVADSYCRHLLRYSPSGALLSDVALDAGFYPTSIWTDAAGSVYSNQALCLSACMPGVTKYSTDGSPLAAVVTDSVTVYSALSDGVAWDGRVLYMDTMGTPPLRRYILDSPPEVAAQAAPIGSVVQHSSAAALSWQASNDADGDPIQYTVYLGTAPGALSPVGRTAFTALTSPGLSFGATYYWRVVGQDSYLGLPVVSATSPVVSFNLGLRNEPPDPFGFVAGTGTVVTRATSAVVAWQAASDPDGDAVTYDLAVGTAPGALALVQSSSATAYAFGVSFGATYYWQVTARDGLGGSTVLGPLTLLPVFLNTSPDAPRLADISPTVKTMDAGVRVSWSKVASPQGDPLTYTLLMGASPGDLTPVASVLQSSGSAVVTVAPRAAGLGPSATLVDEGDSVALLVGGLGYYKDYYLRVGAETLYGARSQSDVQSFRLAAADGFPRAYNYPNPFSPARGGTHLVFNAPPSGYARARLTVYSEFGRKLFEREYGPLPPGVTQYDFDGRDAGGRPLPNGSYAARVRFDGPSDRATFFLLVVR